MYLSNSFFSLHLVFSLIFLKSKENYDISLKVIHYLHFQRYSNCLFNQWDYTLGFLAFPRNFHWMYTFWVLDPKMFMLLCLNSKDMLLNVCGLFYCSTYNSKDIPHFDLIKYFKKYELPFNNLLNFVCFDRFWLRNWYLFSMKMLRYKIDVRF